MSRLVQLYYFNDERQDINIFANGGMSGDPVKLEAMQGKTFEFELEDDEAIFIKKWPTYIMFERFKKGPNDALLQDIQKVKRISY